MTYIYNTAIINLRNAAALMIPSGRAAEQGRRAIMAVHRDFDRDVTFEITEHLGVLATYSTGWTRELNIVSWNGGTPKYDIRDWDPAHEHMSRGITLHEKEMRLMLDIIRRHRSKRRSQDVIDRSEDDIPVTEDDAQEQ